MDTISKDNSTSKNARLFRPWDKTSDNNKCDEVNTVPKVIATIIPPSIPITTPPISATTMGTTSVPFDFYRYPVSMDYSTMFYPHMSAAAMVDPYIGLSAVEQEYYRVLGEEAQSKMANMKKQRPKKFKCPHCDVAFSNNGQLKGHIRIHTGERPFKCDDKSCGKTFTRNEELTRHKRIHTGVRPFPCATCGKRFGRRDHLKKHTKTHFVQDKYINSAALYMPAVCPPFLYGY